MVEALFALKKPLQTMMLDINLSIFLQANIAKYQWPLQEEKQFALALLPETPKMEIVVHNKKHDQQALL